MRKVVKNIHLWLSVPFGIFITLICLSGAALVFESEISEWVRGGVAPAVDAATGRPERLPFFMTMFRLHRWLLGSPTTADGSMSVGKWVVALSTIALILILLTGLILCLTGKRSFRSCLTISCKQGWPRFWHDLHVAGGLYSMLFLLASALTGLTWSFSWYRTGFYGAFGVEAPVHGGRPQGAQRLQADGEKGPKDLEGQQGLTRHDGTPDGRPDGKPAGAFEGRHGGRPEGQRGGRPEGQRGGRPEGGRGGEAYQAAPQAATAVPQSAAAPAQDKASRVRKGIYETHVGKWGGIWTRIVTFLAVLVGATLPITGYYLWVKRLRRQRQAKA
jgi:uncharacterized iron-regulated membrane protein